MNLTERTVTGVRWTTTATLTSSALQLLYAAIMARLLDPTAFGLLALAMVALNFASYLARMGLGPAMVQKLSLTQEDVRAAFTAGTLLGLAAYAALWAAAPAAGAYFQEPDVIPVLRVLGLTMLLTGLQTTAEGLLRRKLDFKRLGIISIMSYTLGYLGVGISLAVLGAGVYSLVWASITQAAIATVAMYALVRHPLRPMLSPAPYRALLAFGTRMSVVQFLEFLLSNLDSMLVGRFVSASFLGLYNRAYYLSDMPVNKMRNILGTVLFSSFSIIQKEVERLRRAYLSAVGAAAGIVVPTCAGMAVAANEIILVVLGDQWSTSAALMPYFALAAAMKILSRFAGTLCESVALLNQRIVLLILTVASLLGFLMLARGGSLSGYAMAVAAAATVNHVGYVIILNRWAAIPVRMLVRTYLPALLAGGAVAVAVGATRHILLLVGAPLIVVLIAEIATGMLTLGAMFWYGPLRGSLKDVAERLERAGMLRRFDGKQARLRGVLRQVASEGDPH